MMSHYYFYDLVKKINLLIKDKLFRFSFLPTKISYATLNLGCTHGKNEDPVRTSHESSDTALRMGPAKGPRVVPQEPTYSVAGFRAGSV